MVAALDALVADEAVISVAGDAGAHVSRGALKLLAALRAFGLSPHDVIALDVGASTGGFTEVLLAEGAAKVYAVEGPLFFGSTDGFSELFTPEADPDRVIVDFAASE